VAEREMLRLKSFEGSDGTALALLSNDINASVGLCKELLEHRCCAAASILNAAEDALAAAATQRDRVMFGSAPSAPAAEAAAHCLLLLQRCVEQSNQLRSQGGGITRDAVVEAINSCRCGICAVRRVSRSTSPPAQSSCRTCVTSLADVSEIAKKRLFVMDELKQQARSASAPLAACAGVSHVRAV
jgi:hypothetical protein